VANVKPIMSESSTYIIQKHLKTACPKNHNVNVKHKVLPPSLKAHWAVLISVSLALSQTPVFSARDHRYGASASRDVPVYVPAFAGTHCTYPWRDSQAELTSHTGGMGFSKFIICYRNSYKNTKQNTVKNSEQQILPRSCQTSSVKQSEGSNNISPCFSHIRGKSTSSSLLHRRDLFSHRNFTAINKTSLE